MGTAQLSFDDRFLLALSLPTVLLAAGLSLRLLSRADGRAPARPQDERPSPLALIPLLITSGLAAAIALHLEWTCFDYHQLVLTKIEPFQPTDRLFFLSDTLVFSLDLLLGGQPWFCKLVNACAYVGSLAGLATLLRQARFTRTEAWLAAALFGLAPAHLRLLAWGEAIQHLMALDVIFWTLNFIAFANRTTGQLRTAWTVLALALGSLGVFVKYPSMAILPPAAFVWNTLLSAEPVSWRRRLGLPLALAGVIALPVWLIAPVHEGGEFMKFGIDALLRNVGALRSNSMAAPVFGLLRTLLVLALLGLLAMAARTWRQSRVRALSIAGLALAVPWVLPYPMPVGVVTPNRWWDAAERLFNEGVASRVWPSLRVLECGLLVALIVTGVRSFTARPPWTRLELRALQPTAAGRRVLGIALLWGSFTLPFLLNHLYFEEYYLVYGFAWISALAAWLIGRVVATTQLSPWLAAIVLIPQLNVREFSLQLDRQERDRQAQQLLSQLSSTTRGRPMPCAVDFIPACEGGADAAAEQRLRADLRDTEGLYGVRWATGWLTMEFRIKGQPVPLYGDASPAPPPTACAAPLTLRYCPTSGFTPIEPTLSQQ